MITSENIFLYARIDEDVKGPFDFSILSKLFHEGRINATTPCSRDGMIFVPLSQLGSSYPDVQLLLSSVNSQSSTEETSAPLDQSLDDALAALEAGYEAATKDAMDELEAGYEAATNPFSALDEEDLSTDVNDNSPIIVCPHCWKKFHQSGVFYISRHPDLLGDPVLGPYARTRFLPEHFSITGIPLDARGMECPEMACPKCHLPIPEPVINHENSIISIVGAPSSGKSYFLTALIHRIKSLLTDYGYMLSDADASTNMVIDNYEQLLFNTTTKDFVALPKTELQGSDFSSQVVLNHVTVNLPLPFIFNIKKLENADSDSIPNLVFYDNAGEHFEPGRDTITNLATQHLLHTECLIFLFDPFKHARFQALCSKDDPQAGKYRRDVNQMQILTEMITRIKMSGKVPRQGKYSQPLYVVIPKFDAWKTDFIIDLNDIPASIWNNTTNSYDINISGIKLVSWCLRQKLMSLVPELVIQAEAFFETVYFLPATALGTMPIYDEASHMLGVDPSKISPQWVEIPLLIYFLKIGLLRACRTTFDGEKTAPAEKVQCANGTMRLLQGTRHITIPELYHEEVIYTEEDGLIRLPKSPAKERASSSSAANEKSSSDDFWSL